MKGYGADGRRRLCSGTALRTAGACEWEVSNVIFPGASLRAAFNHKSKAVALSWNRQEKHSGRLLESALGVLRDPCYFSDPQILLEA